MSTRTCKMVQLSLYTPRRRRGGNIAPPIRNLLDFIVGVPLDYLKNVILKAMEFFPSWHNLLTPAALPPGEKPPFP